MLTKMAFLERANEDGEVMQHILGDMTGFILTYMGEMCYIDYPSFIIFYLILIKYVFFF